jgi:hypothetical protein
MINHISIRIAPNFSHTNSHFPLEQLSDRKVINTKIKKELKARFDLLIARGLDSIFNGTPSWYCVEEIQTRNRISRKERRGMGLAIITARRIKRSPNNRVIPKRTRCVSMGFKTKLLPFIRAKRTARVQIGYKIQSTLISGRIPSGSRFFKMREWLQRCQ